MLHKSQQHGESWIGDYFRSTVLADLVIPFLRDPDNVLDVNEVTFLHYLRDFASRWSTGRR